MIPIVEMKFGSHLYGTHTAASDLDYKEVFVPPAREIVLQRIVEHRSNRRAKAEGEKNSSTDVDRESFALHRYLAFLAEGQPMALDMLFAPRSALMAEPLRVWYEIVANRTKLITRQTTKFVTYCESQAKKYGIKGSRVHAVRSILLWFDEAIATHGKNTRLEDAATTLPAFIADRAVQFTQIVLLDQRNSQPILHLECCDLKVSFRARLKDARTVYQRIMDQYGARALMAETNEGVDWKAVSHSVRVGHEAVELLNTGWITFPRPEAAHLLDIKLGRLPYQDVADEIEDLLVKVSAADANSTLPDEPDYEFIDSLVADVYGKAVAKAYSIVGPG